MVGPAIYYRDDSITLYLGDCLEILPSIPAGPIDMIFADPPYFLSKGGPTCKGGRMVPENKADWDRPGSFESSIDFTRAWLSECRRVLAPDGTIWVPGTHDSEWNK